MQIHRYDIEAHGYAQPKSALRASSEQGGAEGVAANSSRPGQSAPKTETSDSRLATLAARLKNLPQIRSGAVEAAKEKLARGEFTTRQAAQQLATTDLRTEIF